MPSTPDIDFMPELNSPDRHDLRMMQPYLLRHQQLKNVLSTAECLEQQNQRLHKPLKVFNISTPDSSQTDSDDLSPKIQRRRVKHEALPRLSISMEHDYIIPSTSSSDFPPVVMPAIVKGTTLTALEEISPIQMLKKKSSSNVTDQSLNKSQACKRLVVKSASAMDLSLAIPSSYNDMSSSNQIPTMRDVGNTRFIVDGYCDNLGLSGSNRSSLSFTAINSPSGAVSDLETKCGGSSTASSRDSSPCRDQSLKPPIILRRGPKGFGFTIHTIRVIFQ